MFDIIGKIYKETGKVLTDEDGNKYPEMTAIEGYHVNCLPEDLTLELEPYVVEPTAKRRVFAGNADNTICLKFADEAEFIEITDYKE